MSFNLLSVPDGKEPTEVPTVSSGGDGGTQLSRTDSLHSSPTAAASVRGGHSQTQLSITGEASMSPPAKAQSVRGGMGGANEYMDGKVRRLREQYLGEQAARSCSSTIFTGVNVWVDGRTNPPKDEIELIMKDNSGTFSHYFFPDVVTHIIAESLAPTHIIK